MMLMSNAKDPGIALGATSILGSKLKEVCEISGFSKADAVKMFRKYYNNFINGSLAAGIGFGIGVLAQGNFTRTIDDPLSLENISGDAYLGSAGKGVSIDVGGNVHVDFALERIGDQSPAPLPLF